MPDTAPAAQAMARKTRKTRSKPIKEVPSNRPPSTRMRVEFAMCEILEGTPVSRQTLALEMLRVAVAIVHGCEDQIHENVAQAMRRGAQHLDGRIC